MINKIRFFEPFLNENWSKNWTIFGHFFHSFFCLFSKPRFVNYESMGWGSKRPSNVVQPDSTRKVAGTVFLIIRKKKFLLFIHVSNFEKFFFHGVHFSIFFLKNRLFSNFVLISDIFQKIEKNEEIRTKLSQNKRKNHEKVGSTLSVLSKIVHFWRFCRILTSFFRCFCQLCPYFCVFLFFIFSTFFIGFGWVFRAKTGQRNDRKLMKNMNH